MSRPAPVAARPRVVVGILGTGTDVGKTWVGARLLDHLRRVDGLRVAARKPVQSFAPGASDVRSSVVAVGPSDRSSPPSAVPGPADADSTVVDGAVTDGVASDRVVDGAVTDGVASDRVVDGAVTDGVATDADLLAAATGERPVDVCPPHRWYPVPVAPPMAVDRNGGPELRLADLLAELHWPEGIDVGLVESVGGVRSPVSHDADSLALVRAVAPDLVVLVADAGLGTINAVRLALAAIVAELGTGSAVCVVLDRFDPAEQLHVENLAWLRDRDGLDVLDVLDVLAAGAGGDGRRDIGCRGDAGDAGDAGGRGGAGGRGDAGRGDAGRGDGIARLAAAVVEHLDRA